MRVQLNFCKNMGWNRSTAKPSTELVWEGMGLKWLSFYEKFECDYEIFSKYQMRVRGISLGTWECQYEISISRQNAQRSSNDWLHHFSS